MGGRKRAPGAWSMSASPHNVNGGRVCSFLLFREDTLLGARAIAFEILINKIANRFANGRRPAMPHPTTS